MDVPAFERHLAHLKRDFHIEVETRKSGDAYRLGAFKAFVGQDDHLRHEAFMQADQDQLNPFPATRVGLRRLHTAPLKWDEADREFFPIKSAGSNASPRPAAPSSAFPR